jgi:hypothetical protein
MVILGQLLHVLSETVEAWEEFRSSDGDSGYFKDVGSNSWDQERVLSLLLEIKVKFDALKSVQRTLLSLKERCQKSADAVSMMGSSNAAKIKMIYD